MASSGSHYWPTAQATLKKGNGKRARYDNLWISKAGGLMGGVGLSSKGENIHIPTRKTSKIQIPEPKSFWLSEQYSFQLKIKCCECTWTFLIGATFPFNFSSNNQLYTSNPSLRKGNFRSYVWNTSRLSHLKYEITKTKALL